VAADSGEISTWSAKSEMYLFVIPPDPVDDTWCEGIGINKKEGEACQDSCQVGVLFLI